MNKVFIVLDVNLAHTEDISVPAVFGNVEDAFRYALEDVLRVSGRHIKIHNYDLDMYPRENSRISNNRSLGSDLGITYTSHYGSYPCARMIMERKVN